MEFKEQYKHPNWQKKRLEKLELEGFSCECCGDVETTLHVHHNAYIKGRFVWEYSNDQLSVLCESCHSNTHQKIDELRNSLSRISPHSVDEVLGFVKVISSENSFVVGSCDEAVGVAKHFEISSDEIIALLDQDKTTSVRLIEKYLHTKSEALDA